jgi:endonuclease/exonuclease/phosphatase family metal-dependent hydrolase
MKRTITLAAALAALSGGGAAAQTVLRVMSFNVWGAGANEDKPIDETVAAIRAARADVVGLQETRVESDPCEADSCPPAGDSRAAAIAAALGWHVHDQQGGNDALWANAVVSRHPIRRASPHDLGVELDVDGRAVWIFNVHLDDSPYQPYQLLSIAYGDHPFLATEAEAVTAAARTRGPALALLLADMTEAAGAAATFVTGDFNEPSHRDWTAAAVAAGRHPTEVRWPFTAALEGAGFVDAFRAVHPDPVAVPAFTWTPTGDPADPEDHHDRIDFVFARGAGLAVTDAAIVGEKAPEAQIVSTPWPADHRAVVAEIRF